MFGQDFTNARAMWVPAANATYYPTGATAGTNDTVVPVTATASTGTATTTAGSSLFNGFDRQSSLTIITGIYSTVLGSSASDFLSLEVPTGPAAVTGTFDLRFNYPNLWLPIRGAWRVVKATANGQALITFMYQRENT